MEMNTAQFFCVKVGNETDFTLRQDDDTLCTLISAVIVIVYDFTDNDSLSYSLRVYRNPFAKRHLCSHALKGISQVRANLTTGLLELEQH